MAKIHIPRWLRISLVGVGAFVLLAGGALGGVAYAYKDRFYPGISVAGIDLSGKSYAEGKRLVDAKVAEYQEHKVYVVLPDVNQPIPDSPNAYKEIELDTTLTGLGAAFNGTEVLNKGWAVGHVNSPIAWISQVIPAVFSGNRQALPYSIDPSGVDTYINTAVVPKIGGPTPAKLSVKAGVVSIENSKPGFEVDKAKLSDMLASSVENAYQSRPTYLKAPVSVKESAISRASVKPAADRLESIGALKVNLTAEGISLNPTKAQVLSWISPVQDDQGKISLVLDETAISQYLVTQKSLDQTKSQKAIVAKLGPLVSGDSYSPLSSDSLAIAVTAKPKTVVTGTNYTLGVHPGKYIQVDLAGQRLYAIEGNALVKTYIVSTGKWSTPTPKGDFTINGKIKRAYSRSYGLYMPYWMNFLNNEYGLHELPEWPNGYKEGQSHLGTPVSHGCIRLGVGDAAEIYAWTDNGTPLSIY